MQYYQINLTRLSYILLYISLISNRNVLAYQNLIRNLLQLSHQTQHELCNSKTRSFLNPEMFFIALKKIKDYFLVIIKWLVYPILLQQRKDMMVKTTIFFSSNIFQLMFFNIPNPEDLSLAAERIFLFVLSLILINDKLAFVNL